MKNISFSTQKAFGAIALFVCLFAAASLSQFHKADAAAFTGTQASVATSSTITVGPGNNTYILGTTTRETNLACTSRIITTEGTAIRLSFASLSSTTLSTTVGHLQASSTQVAYDSGLYGCGYWTARGLVASSTITVTETR